MADKEEYKSLHKMIFGDIHKVTTSRLKSMNYELPEIIITPENNYYPCGRCGKNVDNGDFCSCLDNGFPDDGGDNNGGDNNDDGNDYPGGGSSSGGGGYGGGGSSGDPGSGGSSSGGGNTNKPQNYVKQSGDKFAKDNIPTSIQKQVGPTCVFTSMSFINNLLGGDMKDGDYIKEYCIKFNRNIIDISLGGAYTEDISSFVSMYFDIERFTNYKNAIDNGFVVITDITTTELYNHCITIVGYHPNGNLIYMDPQFGALRECPTSYIAGNFNVSIKKNK